MDDHIQGLQSLCRLCGKKLLKAKLPGPRARSGHSYPVIKYQRVLWTRFKIDVHKDSPEIHPPKFCHSCDCHLNLHLQTTWVPKNDWSCHEQTGGCLSCQLYQASTQGGRPKKIKRVGRPPNAKTSRTEEYFQELAGAYSPRPRIQSAVDFSAFELEKSNLFLLCTLCKNMVSCPVETPCRHLFCLDCMSSLFRKVSASCPECEINIHFTQISLPASYITTLLASLKVQCKQCKADVNYTTTNQHTCPISVKEALSDHTYVQFNKYAPLTQFTDKEIDSLGAKLLTDKMKNSDDGQTDSFSAPGQRTPVLTKRITNSWKTKSSSRCHPSTLPKRTRIKENDEQSAVSLDQPSTKLKDEVRSHEDELRGILPDHGGICIPAQDILHLKGFFGLSWLRLRKLKRWLKERKVRTSSERAVRTLQEELIGNHLRSEWVPLEVLEENKTKVIARAPLVTVTNLVAKVLDLLDEYDKLGELTWHDGLIPQNEIWIKLGGVKGSCSKTFQMFLQIANVSHPSSLANTQVIGLFEGSDCHYNLQVALQSLQQEITHLASCAWRGKSLRLFHFGDYEYLTKVYGLSGLTGRHCCLFCAITNQGMIIPPHERVPSQPHTLSSFARSLTQFKERKEAKVTMNVIQEPMFNIPLDQVCPPGLHMSLSIHLKHFEAFERECHKLDLQIAAVFAKDLVEQAAYKDALKIYMQRCKMETKLVELSQDIADLAEQHTTVALLYPEGTPPSIILETAEEKVKEKERVQRALSKLPELPLGAGLVTSQLDMTLESIGVHRPAYHGCTFVGNHVHKCLQLENINKIMNSVTEKVKELVPHCPELHTEAEIMTSSFRNLFFLYGQCHNIFNAGKFLSDEEIDQLDHHIKLYVAYFRQFFPAETFPPMMHVLEEHTIPWMRRWNAAFGFMGEQGGEAVHAQLNTICSDLQGYQDNLKKIFQAVKNQWTKSNPHVFHEQSEELKKKEQWMKY